MKVISEFEYRGSKVRIVEYVEPIPDIGGMQLTEKYLAFIDDEDVTEHVISEETMDIHEWKRAAMTRIDQLRDQDR